jgi:peptidoglycan/xylan/chitin deacetylase (PgdA/CDA1 family)
MSDLQRMTGQLIETLRQNNVPAVGFVNESLLFVKGETEQRIALLESWSKSGVELGNHTFSHLGFQNTPIERFEDDFVRGDIVTGRIQKQSGRPLRYFRHPFLQMGPTREIEIAFERFIGERGYRIAPVTIDTMDWMFLAAYREALNNPDESVRKKVSDEYVRFAEEKVKHCEMVSNELFGRQIGHILLLHANQLNSENLDRLLAMLRARGYRFVTLETALQDPLYAFPSNYAPTSDWLEHWAFSRGKKFESPKPPEFIQKAYGRTAN